MRQGVWDALTIDFERNTASLNGKVTLMSIEVDVIAAATSRTVVHVVSRSDVEKWYIEVHIHSRQHCNEHQDEDAAEQYFGASVPREWLRELRKKHAPAAWKKRGPHTDS